MQLDEFVKTTLMQVVKGVKDAQEEAVGFGAVVNPLVGYGCARETVIAFDVALTVTGASSDEVGGKVTVLPFLNLGGKATESDTKQETSHVKFEVMLTLPCPEEQKSSSSLC